MRKRRPRALPFRLLLILAGVFMLAAAFAPRAHAQSVIAYFNFEHGTLGGAVDFDSVTIGPPDFNPGGGVVDTTMTHTFFPSDLASSPGLLLNRTAGDIDNANPGLGLGMSRTIFNNGAFLDMTLNTAQGFFQDMSVSFATIGNEAGNGFHIVQLFCSTNGGNSFFEGPSVVLTTAQQLVTLPVPDRANNTPLLILSLQFRGSISNGEDFQTIVDNVQVTGTIVPEPSTIAGGLLGVLGLCWQQRRRLIRCVRLRRT